MFEFLATGPRSNGDLFSCVFLDFVGRGWGCIGDFGGTGSCPGFCLGFCFFDGWRGGFVTAYFAEVKVLDWIGLAEGVSCSEGAD
jgi:hypothetical protein